MARFAHWKPAAALALAAILTFPACGGDDDDGGAEPTAAGSPTTSTATQGAATGASPTAVAANSEATPTANPDLPRVQEYPVPAGSRPHDVAPAADGGIWYTAQRTGKLGWLDPETGETREVALGSGSSPHGVILGPDGAPWVTDTGLNAVVRVDPETSEVTKFALPADFSRAGVHTAVFDPSGILWFTGNNGYYGRVDPTTGKVDAWRAPRGAGPYGITSTPDGAVYYASLQNSHIAVIDPETGEATPIEPPTARQGARRVWSDSNGNIWVSEWNAGQLAKYDPAGEQWQEWKLPGSRPQAYAVYVDERDIVWLSDFGGNSLVSFDPATEEFTTYELPSPGGNVRQILGRPGEVWGAESGADKLIVIRTNAGP